MVASSRRALLVIGLGLAFACGAAAEDCGSPCPPPCSTHCSPKICIDVPAPCVVLHAQQEKCCFLHKMCCHWGCKPLYVSPLSGSPVAPAAPAAPYAPPAAPAYAPVAPVAYAPVAYQPVAYQPVAYQPYAAPAAPAAPPAAPAAPASPGGTTCDQALQRLTSQMESLTKVVEAHTQVLLNHESRIHKLENWAKQFEPNKPAPKFDSVIMELVPAPTPVPMPMPNPNK